MLDKQTCGSLLPALVLTVGMAGTSLAASRTPLEEAPTVGMSGSPLTASQAPYEQEIKQADAKIDGFTRLVAEAKRQMDTANNIANSARASKNLPPKLAQKSVAESLYRKDVLIMMNLELASAKNDKARAVAGLEAAKARSTADAAAAEKRNADAKADAAKKKADDAKRKADEAVANAVAAKKDPKVAAAAANAEAARAKTEYDAAAAAKRNADAKAAATAANATRADAAATKAKNAALSSAETVKGQKRIVEQSQLRARSAASAWESERKQMANNPFLRACDNVDREITEAIEKAKDDPVAATASAVKTAIGGLDGLVTSAISAAANTPWFKGTKVGTTVDIAAYLKELPGKPKDTAIDQTANLVSSIYKAKTAKEAFSLFSKAEDQRKKESFTELVDKVFDLIKAYDKDFDAKTYRKVLVDTYDALPPGAKF